MYDSQEAERFFFYFFVFGIPSVIAVCNPHLKMSRGLRLGAIGAFLLAVFLIVRVFVFGVPEYKIFEF
jgi:hypothetical protein